MSDGIKETERENARIRDLVATNKDLTTKMAEMAEQNEKLSKFMESVLAKEEADKKAKEEEEARIAKEKAEAEEAKRNEKLNKTEILEKKFDEFQLEKVKQTVADSGILSKEDLVDLKTVDEVNTAVKLAKKFADEIETKAEEKAAEKAKIIVNQEKAKLEGKKNTKDKKSEDFIASLTKMGLLTE